MATCNNCGQNTTKCGCKDSPLTTPTSYTCPPSESCPDPTPCYETIDACCVVHSYDYGLPCLGVTPGMTLCEILQLLNNLWETIGDGATIIVNDEGLEVNNTVSTLNFIGDLVEATDGGGALADITITTPFLVHDQANPDDFSLADVDNRAFLTFGDLANGTLSDWTSAGSPTIPHWNDFATWLNNYDTSTYMIGYDPVNDTWRPMLAKDYIGNFLAYNLYTDDGFLETNRKIGLNSHGFVVTYESVTNTYTGDVSSATPPAYPSDKIAFIAGAKEGEADIEVSMYSAGGFVRNDHVRNYSTGDTVSDPLLTGYTDYRTWEAAGDPNQLITYHRIQVGFFNGCYHSDLSGLDAALEEGGALRTPAQTEIELYTNPQEGASGTDAYYPDAIIRKFPDQYDIMNQATRTIQTGNNSGDLVFQRLSPTLQHAGTDVGVGSFQFLHGSSGPMASYLYTGQWNWSEYDTLGNFVDNSPTHFLGNDASGNIVQIQPSAMQNIYNVDGTIQDATRTVDGNSMTRSLIFDQLNNFTVQNSNGFVVQSVGEIDMTTGSGGNVTLGCSVVGVAQTTAINGYNVSITQNDANGRYKLRPIAIRDGGTDNVPVLPYNTAPEGAILIQSGLTGDGEVGYTNYGLPAADGGAGQILKRTAANVVSWSSEISTEEQTETGTGNQTLDFSAGNYVNFTFGAGDAAFTSFTDPSQAAIVVLKLEQDGVGGRSITSYPASVKWVGGSAPTLTAGAGAVDVVQFYFDGTNYNELSRSLNLS